MKETNKGPFFGNIFVNQSYYSNIFQLFCVSFCRDFLLFSFCLYNFFCRNILFIALPFFYMTIFFRLDNEIWFNKKLFQKLCKNEWKLNVRQMGFFFFFFQKMLKLPWFCHSTKALLKRMIYRILDHLVLWQRSRKYMKEVLKKW